jgi:hypothetical protein
MAMATFRRKPAYLARETGVPLNIARNSSSLIAASRSRGGAKFAG